MQEKVVLAYQLTKEKEKAIQEICKEEQIRFKTVAKNRYSQPLGYLAGISGIKKVPAVYEGSLFEEEMLVFCGFSGDALDTFLAGCRAKDATVGLKAIITPHNIFWSSEQLFAELCREREAMKP